MFTVILYCVALAGLFFSFGKDRAKTKKSLMVAKNSFLKLLPELSAILLLIGIVLSIFSPAYIARFIGGQSGFRGMLVTSLLGSITLIPGFIAFPLARTMLDSGAGISQTVVFISTLMMVGFVTAPLETRYFGSRQTIIRNVLAYLYSFVVALIVGGVIH